MRSAFRAARAIGLAAGLMLAMSFGGGVASADPDSGAPPPPAPSEASPGAAAPGSPSDSGPGPSPSDSTGAGSASDTAQSPTSKVGNGRSAGSSPDTAQSPASSVGNGRSVGVSSDVVNADQDALAKDLADQADLIAQAQQRLADMPPLRRRAEPAYVCNEGNDCSGGPSLDIDELIQRQQLTNQLSQLQEMSKAIEARTDTDLATMTRDVKG